MEDVKNMYVGIHAAITEKESHCFRMASRLNRCLPVMLSEKEKDIYPCRPIRLTIKDNIYQCDRCGERFEEKYYPTKGK